MEFNEDDSPANEQQGYDVEIYSRSSIFWFTVLFSPIFGGALMVVNLRSAGYIRRAWGVGIFALVFYIAESLTSSYIKPAYLAGYKPEEALLIVGGVTLVFNLIAALIFVFVFYNRYFPESDYYPKSILPPLMVAVVLFIIYSLVAPYVLPR